MINSAWLPAITLHELYWQNASLHSEPGERAPKGLFKQKRDAAEMGVRLKILSIRWKLFLLLQTWAYFILSGILLWQSLAMADYNSAVKCSYSSEIIVSTNFVTFAFYRESSISIHARHKISVLTIFDCT